MNKYKYIILIILCICIVASIASAAIPPKKITANRGVTSALQLPITEANMRASIDKAVYDGFETMMVAHYDPAYIDGVRNHGARDYLKEAFPYANSKGLKLQISFNFNKYATPSGDRDEFRTNPTEHAKFYNDLEWTMQNYPDLYGIDLEELQANYDITKSNPTQLQAWKDFTNELARKSTTIVRKYHNTADPNNFIWSGSCASSITTCPNVGFDVQTLDNEKLFNTFTVENNAVSVTQYANYINAWEAGTKNVVIRASTYTTWTSLSTENPACSPMWGVNACFNQGFFQVLDYAVDNDITFSVFTLGYLNYQSKLYDTSIKDNTLAHDRVRYLMGGGLIAPVPTNAPKVTATPIPVIIVTPHTPLPPSISSGSGSMSVSSNPPGAKIIVDTGNYGITNRTGGNSIKRPAGISIVQLIREGYDTITDVVLVLPNKTVQKTYTMKPVQTNWFKDWIDSLLGWD